MPSTKKSAPTELDGDLLMAAMSEQAQAHGAMLITTSWRGEQNFYKFKTAEGMVFRLRGYRFNPQSLRLGGGWPDSEELAAILKDREGKRKVLDKASFVAQIKSIAHGQGCEVAIFDEGAPILDMVATFKKNIEGAEFLWSLKYDALNRIIRNADIGIYKAFPKNRKEANRILSLQRAANFSLRSKNDDKIENARRKLSALGFDLLSKDWPQESSKTIVVKNKDTGEIVEQSFYRILRGAVPRKSGEVLLAEMSAIAKSHGGSLRDDAWLGPRYTYTFEDADGTIFKQPYRSIKNGMWREARKSLGESICRQILESIVGEPFQKDRTILSPAVYGGRHKSSSSWELDGVCRLETSPDDTHALTLAFEYQGHPSHWKVADPAFKKVSARDREKATLCQRLGIPLVQIDPLPDGYDGVITKLTKQWEVWDHVAGALSKTVARLEQNQDPTVQKPAFQALARKLKDGHAMASLRSGFDLDTSSLSENGQAALDMLRAKIENLGWKLLEDRWLGSNNYYRVAVPLAKIPTELHHLLTLQSGAKEAHFMIACKSINGKRYSEYYHKLKESDVGAWRRRIQDFKKAAEKLGPNKPPEPTIVASDWATTCQQAAPMVFKAAGGPLKTLAPSRRSSSLTASVGV